MPRLTRRQFIGAAAGLAVLGNGLSAPASGLTVNPRSAWGSDLPPKGPLSREDVKFLIVHHSASHNGHSAGDVPDILRGWYHYHTGPDKGWSDIAYNFIIDSEGGLWEGRQGSLDGPVAGDATGGNQGFTQLVCLIGDTNLAPPTAPARASLVQVLAWLGARYGVSTAPGAEVTFTSRGSSRWPSGASVTTPTIAGHRDMSQTSCPGSDLYAYVTGTLRADVETARGGSPSLQSTTTSSTTSTTTTTTTTVAPVTTTIPAPTTTVPPPATTMQAPPSTTFPPPTGPTRGASTTIPVATEPVPSSAGAPTGLIATATAMVLTGTGVLLWRHRRMGGGS